MEKPAAAITEAGTGIDTDALLRLRHIVADARRLGLRRTSARPGAVATRRRGRGTEIDEVRLWSHGDDIRHIDRNSTARTGVPHVRTFRDEREQTTLLLADFRPSMLFGTRRAFRSVAAAEILALAGWAALSAGGRVALLALTGLEPVFVRPAAGERAMLRVIGGLQRAHAAAWASTAPEAPLDAALDIAARALPRGGTLLVASGLDTPGPGLNDAVRRAVHRLDLHIAIVSDAFERAAPPGRYPFLTPEGVFGVRILAAAGNARPPDAVEALRRLGAKVAVFAAELPPERHIQTLERLHAGG